MEGPAVLPTLQNKDPCRERKRRGGKAQRLRGTAAGQQEGRGRRGGTPPEDRKASPLTELEGGGVVPDSWDMDSHDGEEQGEKGSRSTPSTDSPAPSSSCTGETLASCPA